MNDWILLKTKGNYRYKSGGVEPIDLFKNGDMLQDFALGCIIKYAYRNRSKVSELPSIDDLDKIIHYAEMLKEMVNEITKD